MIQDLLFGNRNIGVEGQSASPTRILGQFIPSIVLAFIILFVLVGVGTWPGITQAWATIPSLVLLALLIVTWLVFRTRNRSQWYSTPLDMALPIWLIAFGVSTAANWSQNQYILVGLWFSGLYILLWYIGFDVLSNKLLSLNGLVDSLLIAGLVIVATSVYQILTEQPDRAFGLMQNPNILAAFLVLLIPLTFSRVLNTTGYWRVGYLVFMIVAAIVLLLTGSRGGVLGVGCSFGIILYFRVGPRQRLAIIVAILALGIYLVAVRGADGRYSIYRRAVQLIPSRFLTGQGLFTFRTNRFPARYPVLAPPDGQNLHAHDIILQIAIELGFVGVLALLATATQFARHVPQAGPQRWALAAVFGLLIQQATDFTIMTPSIAICAILLLCVATVNIKSSVIKTYWPAWVLAALALVLLVAGFAAGYVPRALL